MKNTVKVSGDCLKLLEQAEANSGFSKTQLIEMCIALYALQLGMEVTKARGLICDELLAKIAADSMTGENKSP